MMSSRVLWCAIFVILTGTTQNIQAGLITDGDFEAFSPGYASPPSILTLGDWQFDNYAGIDAGFPGNPGRAVRLESNGSSLSDPTARQTVSGLTVGATYTLSWDYEVRVNFGGTGGNGPSFGVFLDNQTFADALFLDSSLPGTFVSQSVNFVATNIAHTFIFAGELDGRTNGAGRTDVSYLLDNVDLNAVSVPEPASVILGSIGSLIIAGIAHRYRRNGRIRPAAA